jgi:hypothetical protein
LTISISVSEKDKQAVEYAIKRLSDLGYIVFTDLNEAVEQFAKAISDQKSPLVNPDDFINRFAGLEQVHKEIKLNDRYFENPPIKEYGAYRQFEKRDKRKNFRR